MRYNQYITKKRMRTRGICGTVNLSYGTILIARDGFILLDGEPVCAVTSQNAKEFFWGYDPRDPAGEIKRQETAAELLALAPSGSGDELATWGNPWRRHGHLEAIPGAWRWKWAESVAEYPQFMLDDLLWRVKCGVAPLEG